MKTEIEIIGEALFGKSWMTQIAENLKNHHGETLDRQSVQNWHRRNSMPEWVKVELKELAKKRLNEIKEINNLFDNYDQAVDAAIKNFLWWNHVELNLESIIYCKLTFDLNESGYESYKAEITLDKPDELSGWQALDFDEKYFKRDLIYIRDELKKKLDRVFAIAA